MLKPWSILLPILVTIPLLATEAFAQPPTDSLNGKTIHIYVESDNFDAFYFQLGDIALKSDSKYNYSITLSGIGLYIQDFFFTSNGTAPAGERFKWKFGKAGLNASDEGRYKVSDFQGHQEIWIVVDPSGPVTNPPLLLFEPPKTINILNPWPTTAPKLISGTKTRNMTTLSGRCGWFSAMLLDTTMTKGYFSEISNAKTYGKTGIGGSEDFDFTALFAQYGPTLWLNTETNSWTGTFPNVEGTCQYMLAMTVRDFSKDHPDFEYPTLTGNYFIKGMVQPTLGVDDKPVRTTTASTPPVTFDTFDTWWKTDSTNAAPTMRSYEGCFDIPMSKTNDGSWEFDSYRDSPDHGFWPAEGALDHFPGEAVTSCYVKPPPDSTIWVTNGPKRNGNFCTESHATFTYAPGQDFAFRGDDDVWVFIDGKLVVDLGGVHTPGYDSIDLDKLGLTAGKTYKWDFFQCNRQPCGSALRIKTSLYFKQLRSLYGIEKSGPAPGSITMELWKLIGGNGSCTSTGMKTDTLKAVNLTYQLLDAEGKLVKELVNGNTYYGGITLAEPAIVVDTAKLTPDGNLTPGATYRVVAFESANPTLKVGVSFQIRSASSGLRRVQNPAGGSRPKARYRNVLGRRVTTFPARAHSPLVPQKDPDQSAKPN